MSFNHIFLFRCNTILACQNLTVVFFWCQMDSSKNILKEENMNISEQFCQSRYIGVSKMIRFYTKCGRGITILHAVTKHSRYSYSNNKFWHSKSKPIEHIKGNDNNSFKKVRSNANYEHVFLKIYGNFHQIVFFFITAKFNFAVNYLDSLWFFYRRSKHLHLKPHQKKLQHFTKLTTTY